MAAKAGVRRDADGIWFDGQVGGGGGGGGGGPSDDYAPVTLNFVTDGKIVTLTVLAKTEDTEDVRVFSASDSRLILQAGYDGILTLGKGYLKA
jgi:hypothetical protein